MEQAGDAPAPGGEEPTLQETARAFVPTLRDPVPERAHPVGVGDPSRESKLAVERVQLGVRIEKRMAKVLKATAELMDRSLGELLESLVLHAFEGSRAFTEETLAAIADLKKVYGMGYDLNAITHFVEESGMWQRFTQHARHVILYAQEEAGRLGESAVGTSHLLLGLVRDENNLAARILQERLELPLSRIRAEAERLVLRGPGTQGQEMQLTPRAKRAIDLAYEEARRLNHSAISTEHLLLGVLREDGGKPAADLSGIVPAHGTLEIVPEGWGFLRRRGDLSPAPDDIYVSQSQVQRFGLKTGDTVSGQVRPPKGDERYYGLLRIESVNRIDPESGRTRRDYDDQAGTVLFKLGVELDRARAEVEALQAEGQ